MKLKHIVFDLDGTLIKSAEAKRKCFFQLFSNIQESEKIVEKILTSYPDDSRKIVIPMMTKLIGISNSENKKLIDDYGKLSREAQANCPELDNASKVLKKLHGKYILHLSSNTLQLDLNVVLEKRGWRDLFETISGFPRFKDDNIKEIIERYNLDANEICVVGDGVSDKKSADSVKARYFEVKNEEIENLLSELY